MLSRKTVKRLKLRPIDFPFLDLDDHVLTVRRVRNDIRPIAVDCLWEIKISLDTSADFVALAEELQGLQKDDTIVVDARALVGRGVHSTPRGKSGFTASDDQSSTRIKAIYSHYGLRLRLQNSLDKNLTITLNFAKYG